MVLNYAECFNVYYCTDGYKLIDVKDGAQYLLVPDGKEAPDDLDSDVIVIHQPLERIYMAASAPINIEKALFSVFWKSLDFPQHFLLAKIAPPPFVQHGTVEFDAIRYCHEARIRIWNGR